MTNTVTIELTDKEAGWLSSLTDQYNHQVPPDEHITQEEMAAIYLTLTIEDVFKLRQKITRNQ